MNILSSPIWPSDMPDDRRVIAVLGMVQILEEEMDKFNSRINNALLLIDSALKQIEIGFVRCGTCGEQEDTKDLDFVEELKEARSELIVEAKNSKKDAEIARITALLSMQAEALNVMYESPTLTSLNKVILQRVISATAETVSAWQSKRDNEIVSRAFELAADNASDDASEKYCRFIAERIRAKGE